MRLEIGRRTLDRQPRAVLAGNAGRTTSAFAPQEHVLSRSERRPFAEVIFFAFAIGIAWLLLACFSSVAAEDGAVLSRVTEDIRTLASDEMEGRGPGTQGLEKAGDYIRDTFRQLGLKSGAADDSYRQPFQVSLDLKPVLDKTSLTVRGPEGQAWQLEIGQDFQALAAGGSGKAQAPLVFAGYGISAPSLGYDDFQGLDVEGKVLVVLRQEPQQDDPNSKFDGKNLTEHSYISNKLKRAKERKAAAVLLVNAPFSSSAEGGDTLSAPNAFGSKAEGVPFAHVSQAVVDKLLAAAPLQAPTDVKLTNVVEAEKQIDSQFRPVSQPLTGWSVDIETTFERSMAETANIVGVLEGEGPLAQETIVLGAHYDHIGRGEFGSRKPNSREVHNGADDNATGTAAVLELARRLTARGQKPARRLVFIGFSGEEKGLVGSKYYVEHPLFPVADTVAMLNFDMIGRLRNDELTVFGARSAEEFYALLDGANATAALNLKKVDSSPAMGDHFAFYQRGIPALHFFTGVTAEYHTPEDDFETLNLPGVVRTIDFAEDVLEVVLSQPGRPQFIKSGSDRPASGGMAYLGVTPDYAAGSEGLRITAVAEKSPAAEGGIKPGDVILRFGNSAVGDLRGLMDGLRKQKAGDIVNIEVRREQQSVTCTVTLGSPQGS
jgi:hypothetical protein